MSVINWEGKNHYHIKFLVVKENFTVLVPAEILLAAIFSHNSELTLSFGFVLRWPLALTWWTGRWWWWPEMWQRNFNAFFEGLKSYGSLTKIHGTKIYQRNSGISLIFWFSEHHFMGERLDIFSISFSQCDRIDWIQN